MNTKTQANVETHRNASLRGFAHYLVEQKILTAEEVKQAQAIAHEENTTFIASIIKNKNIASSISEYFNLPYVDLDQFCSSNIQLDIIDQQLMQKHQVIPIAKVEDQLQLAIADPTNFQTLNAIKFHTTLQIKPLIVEHHKLIKLIDAILQKKLTTDDTSTIKFVDQVIADAINNKASDIHFEPFQDCYRIRKRIDGILYETKYSDLSLIQRCSARLKIMANLDITEKRLPQDGRFSFKTHDCRLSTCPTIFGEKIVVRILNLGNSTLAIEQLGLENSQEKLFNETIQLPQGMILVTGPTGSGKTITLYTALNILNTSTKNISTVEDPIEINLAGINQVEVNPKINLNFANVLRAFLRQDPDIIMLGEIRDLTTAEIAIQAAQTGHLVLSTLHTNSACETLTRLFNIGIPNYNIASALNLIIAQRLVRKLCDKCKIKNVTFYSPQGCDQCKNGYAGRFGIFEFLPISKTIREMIMQNCNSIEIEKQARAEGMQTLREIALNKATCGLTSLEEIHRVIA